MRSSLATLLVSAAISLSPLLLISQDTTKMVRSTTGGGTNEIAVFEGPSKLRYVKSSGTSLTDLTNAIAVAVLNASVTSNGIWGVDVGPEVVPLSPAVNLSAGYWKINALGEIEPNVHPAVDMLWYTNSSGDLIVRSDVP